MCIDKGELTSKDYIGYREQALKCEKEGNRFVVEAPYNQIATIVCVKYKTYCHSHACLAERTKSLRRKDANKKR